ncbi:DMT family transporter [Pseudoxanthomonas winnipegensis]|uniref:EamA/RhaT family transporter n=1 Tax=Pseudoxanthomonas winnipegensis TaxID=2480810 RepID=A0A4Q8LUX6_9GAMM|nr:DMT family transporter [Pseudoxanthomonas winnipegensis]RZZ85600.1 EamA/RhaT family transporter [Pseudoxanthomonas winnipegensis]TAA35847.1 EamA/RhaT family transporter [Pseudoxanthomonas winnipegensis]
MSHASPSAACPPTDTARDWRTPIELAVLGVIWGSSFLFMRVAAPHFGAYALVELRLCLGALVLLPFLWRDRTQFPARRWPVLAGIGVLNSALPFLLFAWGAQHAPAAIGAITNAMTVLFTALIAFLFFGEKIGARRAVALLVGFIGVLVLATGKAGGLSVGPAALAGATASLLYGIGYNLVKRHMADLPPASSAAATLGCAALLLSPLAVTHWPTAPVPGVAWACAGALGIVCTGLAYRVYYRLIQRIGPARAATVTYLIPVFGALLAWAILGEPLTWTMLLAAVLILGSVAVSQRAAAGRPR